MLVTLSGNVLLLDASESMESVGRRIDLRLLAMNALSPPSESRHNSDELSRCPKFKRRKEFELLFWILPKSQAELKLLESLTCLIFGTLCILAEGALKALLAVMRRGEGISIGSH